MKWLVRILVGLLALLAIVILVTNAYLGSIVKNTVPKVAPGILGVPVELDDADIRLLRGIVKLKGLRVGNPEGFKSDYAFEMGSLDILLDVKSLATDQVVIKHILIDDPDITFEQTLKGSNFGAIQEGLGGDSTEEEAAPEEAASTQDEAPGKTVVIDDFQLRGATIQVSLPGMMGAAIPIPLPPVVMEGVGRDEGGVSPVDMMTRIFGAIFGAVIDVIKGSANLLGDGVQAVGGAALAVGEGAVDAAGAVGGAAVDAVGAVGGAAVDTVGAVGEGAGNVIKGVGGLIGLGGKDDDASKQENQ
ncbi:MAG: hypothetical protein KDL31_07830 [Kiritimatiellae bacterium]|nr:hypothetical protein [Kiritimatiellia bacterium]